MKKKLIKILLDHDVTFTKEDPNFVNTKGYTLSGFSVMSQRVYGNSKKEILEEMYNRRKTQKKILKEYNKLPSKDELRKVLLAGFIDFDTKYEIRNTEKTKSYPIITRSEKAIEWLKEFWYDDYTYLDLGKITHQYNCTYSIPVKRKNKEVDWTVWEKYRELVEKWETALKKQ